MASEPAIFEAIERSLAMRSDMVRVLQMAKRRQTRAFVRERPAPSAPEERPAWDLFIRRSPMNIVAALDRKSDPTIVRATLIDPENLREVMKVTVPAMTRHMRALTAERTVVSENGVATSTLPRVIPSR